MRIVEFVDTLKLQADKLIVTLDEIIYPNEHGISVRPLQVTAGSRTINMTELISIFGRIPYLSVRETRYRSIYRAPMVMTIKLTPKQYEGTTYYDYYINKLCLRNELKRYETIATNAHEAIKAYKQTTDDSYSMSQLTKSDDETLSVDNLRDTI